MALTDLPVSKLQHILYFHSFLHLRGILSSNYKLFSNVSTAHRDILNPYLLTPLKSASWGRGQANCVQILLPDQL